jgi:hypothetical protein
MTTNVERGIEPNANDPTADPEAPEAEGKAL